MQIISLIKPFESPKLPTTESKGLNGTAKLVDYSIAIGDTLILAECKAIARSYGVFNGQSTAIQHRLRNVISKGLHNVGLKIKWFLKQPKRRNYDISHFNISSELRFHHLPSSYLLWKRSIC